MCMDCAVWWCPRSQGLDAAAAQGHATVVEILLAHGAADSVSIPNEQGRTVSAPLPVYLSC